MLRGFIRQFIQTASAVAVTFQVGDWAVHYAYENRGYEAAGGEYLFILIVYLSVYAGISWLLDILEAIHCRRNRERQMAQSDHDKE